MTNEEAIKVIKSVSDEVRNYVNLGYNSWAAIVRKEELPAFDLAIEALKVMEDDLK